MQDHTGSVAEVIRVLYREMESIVTAYDPIRGPINIMEARKNIRKEGPVNGTSTFPAGIGLWRTEEPFGKAPEHFPRSPIMILGHNWGAVHELEDSYEHGCDYPLDGRTWKYLRLYLKAAKVCRNRLLFYKRACRLATLSCYRTHEGQQRVHKTVPHLFVQAD